MSGNSAQAPAAGRFPLLIALLRIAIGWHFLYEGITKLLYPGWTSAGYLKSATGPLAALFQAMGANAGLVKVIDPVNVWGLIAIGLALMLGVAVRYAAGAGIGLLALYYLSHPPLFSTLSPGPSEGNYLIVNKNLVELFALALLAGCPATAYGIEALFRRGKQPGMVPARSAAGAPADSRRAALAAMIGVPFFGGFVLSVLRKHGWKSFEEVQLASRRNGKEAFITSPTLKSFQFTNVSELKGRLPYGKIGDLALSRMILGGNLIGGWAHARDLIYVSKLIKAYHHRDKVFETLALAEACGVNAILTNPLLCDVINDYWRQGGRIRFISDCGGKDLMTLIQKSIDSGAAACYIQGAVGDRLVREGKFDDIAAALDLIRRNKIPAGIGGHYLATISSCVEKGLKPDFWMKTLHHTNYWSATEHEEKDNIWCEEPAETVAYMKGLKEPWIAFKILAAGAIEPKVGFRYAFENGADFICVGMYDFQIVDDVNIALAVLKGGVTRQREWCA